MNIFCRPADFVLIIISFRVSSLSLSTMSMLLFIIVMVSGVSTRVFVAFITSRPWLVNIVVQVEVLPHFTHIY